MKNFTTQATLIMSLPDSINGISDQEVFNGITKKMLNFELNLIWPAYPGIDKPVVLIRVISGPVDAVPKT